MDHHEIVYVKQLMHVRNVRYMWLPAEQNNWPNCCKNDTGSWTHRTRVGLNM